jgi:glyoxylase-like metal-dependent hydrolase (beta-lactamase superfamily II)
LAGTVFTVGDIEVTPVVTSSFRLDGGSMFGVIPRPLWERKAPPDELNRISLHTNSFVLVTGGKTLVIEAGMGRKYNERQTAVYSLEPLDAAPCCSMAGFDPGDVDAVVLTHLHLDHAGGCTQAMEGQDVPAFPNATVFVSERELAHARSGHPLSSGSYSSRDFEPLASAGLLKTLDGEVEVADGVTVVPSGGHTPGHQTIKISSRGEVAVYPGDLVPTVAHLKPNWLMAWDLFPVEVYERKLELLSSAADDGTLLLFSHDPLVMAGRIRRDGSGFALVEGSVTRSSL